MRAIERGYELVIADVPGLHWVLGFLFIGIGALFVAGPLGLMRDPGTSVQQMVSLAMGICGVAAGFWLLQRAPYSRLQFERNTGCLRITRVGVTGRSSLELPASDVVAVDVVNRKDDEDNDIFQIHLRLRAGSEAVSEIWTHGWQTTIQACVNLIPASALSAMGRRAGPSAVRGDAAGAPHRSRPCASPPPG